MDYKDLMDGYESICREFPLPKYRTSVMHGKMKTEDKDYEMKRFLDGKTQIMVSTTVIEVGVNIPNANVMVIECRKIWSFTIASTPWKSWKR